MTKDDFRKLIIDWNNKFPYDYWWRKKHNVAFLSSEHRGISFFAQMWEYKEEKLYEEITQQKEDKNKYIPNIGDMFKENIYDEESFADIVKQERNKINKK